MILIPDRYARSRLAQHAAASRRLVSSARERPASIATALELQRERADVARADRAVERQEPPPVVRRYYLDSRPRVYWIEDTLRGTIYLRPRGVRTTDGTGWW